MPQDVNTVTISGTISDALDLRFTKGNTAVMNIRLEVEDFYQHDGEWKSSSNWFTAVVWGQKAERMNEQYEEGDRIWIAGELDVNSWEDNDGNSRNDVQIDVQEYGTIQKKSDPSPQADPSPQPTNQTRVSQRGQTQAQPATQGQARGGGQQEHTMEPDDELPF